MAQSVPPADDDDYTRRAPAAESQSWRETWRKAGMLLVGGLALAGAIVVGYWVLSPSTKTAKTAEPSATAVSTPKDSSPAVTTAPAKTSPSPPAIASTPDQDNNYIQALNKRGISFANPDAAINNGKVVCQDIAQGMTVQQIIASFSASNPALGKDADAYVSISVHAYCPQNGNLVGAAS